MLMFLRRHAGLNQINKPLCCCLKPKHAIHLRSIPAILVEVPQETCGWISLAGQNEARAPHTQHIGNAKAKTVQPKQAHQQTKQTPQQIFSYLPQPQKSLDPHHDLISPTGAPRLSPLFPPLNLSLPSHSLPLDIYIGFLNLLDQNKHALGQDHGLQCPMGLENSLV